METLNLCFVGTELDEEIRILLCKEDTTLAITDSAIHTFDRSRLIRSDNIKVDSLVSAQLLGTMLLMLTETSLALFSFPELKQIDVIKFSKASTKKATCMIHPATYLNKMILSFDDGSMELWNINTKKLIYTFSHFKQSVTAITSSPVIDVVAVGLGDGTVWLVDLKQDKLLFSLKHRSYPIQLTFSTDKSEEEAQLAVALADGTVALWDLNERRLFYSWMAHSGPIATCSFIRGSMIILTSSNDNSIKEWLVEGVEVRPLKSRSGHAKGPRKIRFYDEEGDMLLSAGGDRSFRLVSLVKDSQNVELSQGSIERNAKRMQADIEEIKLDPIVDFGCFVTKDLKWDNVVSAHEKSPIARTWRADHKKIGSHQLVTRDGAFVTACCSSACGNYAAIASAKGSIDVYNFQSGNHRRNIPCPSELQNEAIIFVGIDASNTRIVAARRNGVINVFNFATGALLSTHMIEGSILLCALIPESLIIGAALSSNEIHLLDLSSGFLVRKFVGHKSTITDMAFSLDNRWLLSCAHDGTTRIWDIIIGRQIDMIQHSAGQVPISIAISPTILAIAFESDVAIHTFTNLSLYRPVALDIASNTTSFPATQDSLDDVLSSFIQLSLEPRSKASNLYHLETIKARNKPVLPAKVVEKAPFFLDAILSSGPVNRSNAENPDFEKAAEGEEAGALYATKLESLLKNPSGEPLNAMQYMLKLSPAQIDLEIQSLHATPLDGPGPLLSWFRVLTKALKCHHDYDLVITFLNLTLRSHSSFILSEIQSFQEDLASIGAVAKSTWGEVEPLFQRTQCLLVFSRDNLY